MISVYIVGAKDLPATDHNGLSDPYVELYAKNDTDLYSFGRTEIIPKTLEPEWDTMCEKPFNISFARMSILRLELYDYDTVGSNDFIGYVEIPYLSMILNKKQTYNVISDIDPNKNPTITILVRVLTNNIPDWEWKPQFNSLVSFFTYDPPLNPATQTCELRFFQYDEETGGAIALPGYGTLPICEIEMDAKPSHRHGSGTTNVAVVRSSNARLIPVLNCRGYKGIVTLNVAGAIDGQVKARAGKTKAHILDTEEKRSIFLFQKHPIDVYDDGTFTFGVTFIGTKSSMLDMAKALQKNLLFEGEAGVCTSLILGSALTKFGGMEGGVISMLFNVVEHCTKNYDKVLHLTTKLCRRSAFKERLISSVISPGEDSIDGVFRKMPRLKFLYDLIEKGGITAQEVANKVIGFDGSYAKSHAFVFFIYFAPEIKEVQPHYFDRTLQNIQKNVESIDSHLRKLADSIDDMFQNNFAKLRAIRKDYGEPESLENILYKNNIQKLNEIIIDVDPGKPMETCALNPINAFSNAVTPIDYASFFGASECLEALLEKGSKYPTTPMGRLVTDFAVASGRTEILDMLASKNLLKPESIYAPVAFANTQMYSLIIAKSAKLLSKGIKEMSPKDLSRAALSNGNFLQYTQVEGNLNGELLSAVRQSHIMAVRFLITELKVSVNTSGSDGVIPLQIAVDGGDIEMVRTLLSFEDCFPSSIDSAGHVPMDSAVRTRNLEVAKAIAKSTRFAPMFCATGQRAPLHRAAYEGSPKLVWLLASYTDLSEYSNGRTALQEAAAAGRRAACAILLAKGADPLQKTEDGKSILEIADPSVVSLFQNFFDDVN